MFGIERRMAPVLGLLLALFVVSCGGEDAGDRPTPTASIPASAQPSSTATLPRPTRSRTPEESETVSERPSRTASRSPEESPAESEAPAPTTAPPTTAPPTSAPTTASPSSAPSRSASSSPTPATSATPQGSAAATPSPSPSAGDAAAGDEAKAADGVPQWVWWLLAAVVVAAALTALLVPRARRRRAWRADLASAQGEAAWFARELLPQLQQARSRDELAGGWQVAGVRVVAVEDRLTGLETSAPDEPVRAQVHELRDAVRAARKRVEELSVSGESSAIARELGALAPRLTAALEPVDPQT